MYAVIETGGKQYRVELGSEIAVERLDGDPGETLEIERVLLVADDDDAAIGRPLVEGARVSASIVRQDRGDKVVVFKYKPKARRRVKHGHRQDQTVLRVADIVYGGKSAAKLAEAALTERQRLDAAAAAAAAERAAADRALADKLAAEEAARAAKAAAQEAPAGAGRGRGRRRAAAAEEQAAEEHAEEEHPEAPAESIEPASDEAQAKSVAPEADEKASAAETSADTESGAETSVSEAGDAEGGAAEAGGDGPTEEPAPEARPRRTRSRKDE